MPVFHFFGLGLAHCNKDVRITIHPGLGAARAKPEGPARMDKV